MDVWFERRAVTRKEEPQQFDKCARAPPDRRPNSLIQPGVREPESAALKVICISSSQQCAMYVGNSRDLGVHFGDGTSLFAPVRGDSRKRARSLLIKREDVSGKILRKHRLRLGAQFVSPPAGC